MHASRNEGTADRSCRLRAQTRRLCGRAMRRVLIASAAIVIAIGLTNTAFAEERIGKVRSQSQAEPTPLQDDANLHDVCFISQTAGWAVGDHGTVWHTEDGERWRLIRTPADCALRSACFLSDRVGWIAGGATMPFTRLGVGVVLATTDGGQTWSDLAAGRLPQLHYVRFFSLTDGVVVGEATAEFPTGVITTHDGGKTWKGTEGDRRPGCRAAAFATPENGIAAGLDGSVARVDGKMFGERAGGFGRRQLRDVKLVGDAGWVVG